MDLVSLIVTVGILVIVVIVLYWLLNQIPLDPVMKQVITVALVVLVAVVAIIMLLRISGYGGMRIGWLAPLIGLG